jgi:hypothetical protein
LNTWTQKGEAVFAAPLFFAEPVGWIWHFSMAGEPDLRQNSHPLKHSLHRALFFWRKTRVTAS